MKREYKVLHDYNEKEMNKLGNEMIRVSASNVYRGSMNFLFLQEKSFRYIII